MWTAPGRDSTKVTQRMDLSATLSLGRRKGSGVVGSRGPGPPRLSYKVHSNEKHTGGLRFLTEKARRQFRKTHFPSPGQRLLHAITPPAKRGRDEEGKIDSGVNKLPAPMGVPV